MTLSARILNLPGVLLRRVVTTAALIAIATPGAPTAAEEQSLTVVVRDGQSLRDIAEEYFNDPNLWGEILRVNELGAAENVKPGMKLKVPSNEITLANAALVSSLEIIQKATETGAQIFAADELKGAVGSRQEALARRQRSDWAGCRNLAIEAEKAAEKAFQVALSQRNAAAEAVLRGASGTVQSRKPSDLVWNNIKKGATLRETEKVRTMSSSTAEILFVDESRIRLVANSQAVIQKMRVDRLNQQQKASVSLLEGDVYALLSSAGNGKGVDVKVEGVTTDSASTDFWISRQGKQTKYANYDEEHLQITSAGETVTLGRNQGTIVEAGRRPSVVRDLLASPTLVAPEDDFVQFGEEAPALRWEALEGAIHYKLEASTDPSFSEVVLLRSRKEGTEHRPDHLDDGVYYWRVTAIDDLGFPGAKSRVRRFQVMQSVGAPYLALATPSEGAISRAPVVMLEGTTATRSRLAVNGSPIEVAANGDFSVEHALVEGENVLALEVTGESGRSTRLERRVFYMPDRPAVIEYSLDLVRLGPRRFVTRQTSLLLAGRTTPEARIDVLGANLSTYSDAEGRFQLYLPVSSEQEDVSISVTTPSGHRTEDSFTVVRDVQPPELRVSGAPDAVTAAADIALGGSVTGCHELRLNGKAIPVAGDMFATRHPLEPGSNLIELLALDHVGNQTLWTRVIERDSDPPALGRVRVSPQKVSGGEMLEITVEASDLTEMKRFAAALVRVGTWKENASLALEPEGGIYRGSIRVPRDIQGSVVLKHVILEDYLGNKKAYPLH